MMYLVLRVSKSKLGPRGYKQVTNIFLVKFWQSVCSLVSQPSLFPFPAGGMRDCRAVSMAPTLPQSSSSRPLTPLPFSSLYLSPSLPPLASIHLLMEGSVTWIWWLCTCLCTCLVDKMWWETTWQLRSSDRWLFCSPATNLICPLAIRCLSVRSDGDLPSLRLRSALRCQRICPPPPSALQQLARNSWPCTMQPNNHPYNQTTNKKNLTNNQQVELALSPTINCGALHLSSLSPPWLNELGHTNLLTVIPLNTLLNREN